MKYPVPFIFALVAFLSGCQTATELPTKAPPASHEIASAPEITSAAVTSAAPIRLTFHPGTAKIAGIGGWWATGWTPNEGAGFKGEPKNVPEKTVVVRYSHYTVCYDLERRITLWGAYTVDKSVKAASDSKLRTEKNDKEFDRPSGFSVEPLVAQGATRLGLSYARDADYGDAIDPRFPVDKALTVLKASYADSIIQRGHIVPNNAMKCTGDLQTGKVAQRESFSLANVAPQMNAHNAPTWSALEEAVIDWTVRFDRVWVIGGPVITSQPPIIMKGRLKGEDRRTVMPDAMFYVIVVQDGGKLRTAAFVIPHLPQNLNFTSYAKSVDDVEQMTGLNFLPELGEPNTVEGENGKWLGGRN